MISMHDFMAAIGYLISFAGAITLTFFIVALCVNYCTSKWWDFRAVMRVVQLASKNGIRITRNGDGQ